MDVRGPFPGSYVTIVHMQQINLLQSFLADEIDFETSVEILVSRVFVVIAVLQLEDLVDRDDSTLHSLHCINELFLRIWE